MDGWRERAHNLAEKRMQQRLRAVVAPHTVPFRERPEFIRGRAAEQLAASWLQEQGWYVIPSYDYAGEDGDKPPRLQGVKVAHPVPDLDVAKSGQRRWVEVKTKARANLRYTTGIYEHGIDLRLLQHYETVQKITGTDVWIAIYEEDTRQLRANTLAALGEPRIGTNPSDGKKLANWDRERFILLTQFPATHPGDGTT